MNTRKLTQSILSIIFFVLVGLSSWAQNQQSPRNKLSFSKFVLSTDEKRVSISWSIKNSMPTNYFEIQKSTDGVNFKTIALVLGPDPKQLKGDSYGCFDKYVRKEAKHAYYRLKHIDINGTEQLSEAKLLKTI
jgi:hypothetical protein